MSDSTLPAGGSEPDPSSLPRVVRRPHHPRLRPGRRPCLRVPAPLPGRRPPLPGPPPRRPDSALPPQARHLRTPRPTPVSNAFSWGWQFQQNLGPWLLACLIAIAAWIVLWIVYVAIMVPLVAVNSTVVETSRGTTTVVSDGAGIGAPSSQQSSGLSRHC